MDYTKWIILQIAVLNISYAVVSNVTRDENCDRSYFSKESGFIESHNFPFSYKPVLDCHYILPNHESGPATVCFEFHSFHMVNPEDSVQFIDVYGIEYRYGLNGELISRDVHTNNDMSDRNILPKNEYPDILPKENVWNDNFCWSTIGGHFSIRFQSGRHSAGHNRSVTRFHASYKMLPWLPTHQEEVDSHYVPGKVNFPSAPCAINDWTCFSRECIDKEKVCDGTDDCSDSSDESYVHTHSCGKVGFNACDFGFGSEGKTACGLSLTQMGVFSGRLHPYRGPTRDHTQATNSGKRFLGTSFSMDNDTAIVTDNGIDGLSPSYTYCFSFWYHMYGRDPGNLTVYSPSVPARLLWIRSGNHQDVWLHGEVRLDSTSQLAEQYTIALEAKMGSDVKTMIGVDDFYLRQGNCSGDDVACTFELGFCDWTAESDNGEFRLVTGPGPDGKGPTGDQSSYDKSGGYLYWSGKPSSSLDITSPSLSMFSGRHEDACMQFWYHYMSDSSSRSRLYLSLVLPDWTESRIRRLSIRRSSSWTQFTYSFKSSTAVKMRISFETNAFRSSSVSIDDIRILPGSCDAYVQGTCTKGEFRCWDGQCIASERVCDGYKDCGDGYDESAEACNDTKCDCDYEQFCCQDWNLTCINGTLVCDGIPNCPNEADEQARLCHPYRRLPAGVIIAIMMIGAVALAVLIIVLVKCIKWLVRNDCPNGMGANRDTVDRGRRSSAAISISHEELWDSPPTYADAVDNPAYPPPPPREDSEGRGLEGPPPPPRYERVVSGEFKELVWPTKAELAELKEQTIEKYKVSLEIEENSGQDQGEGSGMSTSHLPRLRYHPPVRQPIRGSGAKVTIDKEAVRKILRGSFRNRTREPGASGRSAQPMITIQIFGSDGRAGRARPALRTAPLGAANHAFEQDAEVETSLDAAGRKLSPSHLSQTNVNIQLVTDSESVSRVTVDTTDVTANDGEERPDTLLADERPCPEPSISRESTHPCVRSSILGDDDCIDEPAVPSVNL